jgi:16S rRNA (guanine527-N7)-methyltransferase
MSADQPELRRRLARALKRVGMPLAPPVQEAMLAYIELLARWNRVYNLTAVRDPGQMVARHLADSLSVAPYLQGPRVLDVGSGAGLPGIPLALACPRWRFWLLDSNAKKTRFMTQAAGELALNNVSVVHARVEAYRPGFAFDTIVCRAFARLAEIAAATRHLYRAGSRLVAMKGEYPADELRELPDDFAPSAVEALSVPGLDAARHVVCITPRMPTLSPAVPALPVGKDTERA